MPGVGHAMHVHRLRSRSERTLAVVARQRPLCRSMKRGLLALAKSTMSGGGASSVAGRPKRRKQAGRGGAPRRGSAHPGASSAADVVLCAVCSAAQGSRDWADAENDDEPSNACKECRDLGVALGYDDFEEFAGHYHDDEGFAADTEKARAVKKGGPRLFDQGTLVETTRFGFRVEDDVKLYTKAQLREVLPEGCDVDKLKVPVAYVRDESGEKQQYFVVKDSDGPKRGVVFMEWAGQASTTRMDPAALLSESHLATMLSKLAAAHYEKPEFQALMKPATVEDLEAKAEQQRQQQPSSRREGGNSGSLSAQVAPKRPMGGCAS